MRGVQRNTTSNTSTTKCRTTDNKKAEARGIVLRRTGGHRRSCIQVQPLIQHQGIALTWMTVKKYHPTYENRSHAAWRETPRALPIVSQLTPRLRRISTLVRRSRRTASSVCSVGASDFRSCESV